MGKNKNQGLDLNNTKSVFKSVKKKELEELESPKDLCLDVSKETDKRKLEIKKKKYEAIGDLYDSPRIQKLYVIVQELININHLNDGINNITGIDIVNDIACKLLEGKRKWDVEKYPDAFEQILYIAKHSELKNYNKKTKNFKRAGTFDNDDNEDESQDSKTPLIESISFKQYNDEQKEIDEKNELYDKTLIINKEISKMSTKDQEIFEDFKQDKSYKEIAEHNNISEDKVKNWKKRVDRRLINCKELKKYYEKK